MKSFVCLCLNLTTVNVFDIKGKERIHSAKRHAGEAKIKKRKIPVRFNQSSIAIQRHDFAIRGPPTRIRFGIWRAGASDVSSIARSRMQVQRASPYTGKRRSGTIESERNVGPPTIQRSMKPVDARSVVNLRHVP